MLRNNKYGNGNDHCPDEGIDVIAVLCEDERHAARTLREGSGPLPSEVMMKTDLRRLFPVLALLLLTASLSAVAAEPVLPRIDFGEETVDALAGGALSDVRTGDGPAHRVVEPGVPVVLALEPWWGEGVQPPAGQVYMATVRYQDTLEQPAVFLSYAGIAGNGGPSEMHRFGGLNDKQWKTVQVPLPYDMLLRDFDSGRVRLGIRAAGPLPLAALEIGPIATGAAERWNRETREWVRRAQADLKPAPVEKQEPVIPASMKDAAIVPYTRPYVRVVLPSDVPGENEAGAALRVRMALNEYEPGTFAVYAPKQKLTNVTYEVSDLKNDDGRLAVEVSRGTIEYTLRDEGEKGAAVRAERIWPMYAVDIEPNESHWFWITFKTDASKAKPGKYTGTITVKADQGQASLPIEMEVLPLRLVTVQEAGLTFGGCHPALLPEHEMRQLVEYNLTVMNTWASSVLPDMKIVDGKMTLDFRHLDHWMRTARRSGVQAIVWFLGGVPYGYPQTMTIERELYIALHEGKKPRKELYDEYVEKAARMEYRGRTLPEVEPYYRQWVREVYEHSRANGWPEIILTPFDEPAMWTQGPYRRSGHKPPVIGAGPWIRDHFEFACKLMREEAPGMRVYLSLHGNHLAPADYRRPQDDEYPSIREGQVFIDDIDICCTNAIDSDPQLGEKTRSVGKDFWQYTGVSYGQPDRTRYSFGFFFSAFNSRGGLVWAYDWGSGWDTSRGANWYLAWRTPLSVIPSPAYECLREGLDDRRYVETLKRLALDHQTEVGAFLKQLGEAAVALRTKGGRDTVNDFFAESSDLEAMDAMRSRVIEEIQTVVKQGWRPSRPYPQEAQASDR